jgi:hypothetical protein
MQFFENIFEIKYNSNIIPNWKKHDIFLEWANCQVFAYELLRYNWKTIPDFRSSELCIDKQYSFIVNSFKPLDILFFNDKQEFYGSHLWVYIWNNKIIHLSKSIWKPVIWELEQFNKNKKYQIFYELKGFYNI